MPDICLRAQNDDVWTSGFRRFVVFCRGEIEGLPREGNKFFYPAAELPVNW
jgi:hypothetical protein